MAAGLAFTKDEIPLEPTVEGSRPVFFEPSSTKMGEHTAIVATGKGTQPHTYSCLEPRDLNNQQTY